MNEAHRLNLMDYVNKASAWDALAIKNAEISRLRRALRDVMKAENDPYEVARLALLHEEQR